jgi:hypothetical protein
LLSSQTFISPQEKQILLSAFKKAISRSLFLSSDLTQDSTRALSEPSSPVNHPRADAMNHQADVMSTSFLPYIQNDIFSGQVEDHRGQIM